MTDQQKKHGAVPEQQDGDKAQEVLDNIKEALAETPEDPLPQDVVDEIREASTVSGVLQAMAPVVGDPPAEELERREQVDDDEDRPYTQQELDDEFERENQAIEKSEHAYGGRIEELEGMIENINETKLDGLSEADKKKLFESLNSLTEELKKRTPATKRVNSGSKPRPNVKYTLLAKPPNWSSTPQIAQLQKILFEDPEVLKAYTVKVDGKEKVVIPEPELFALLEKGQVDGKLRSVQPAVRIFQYYRSKLRESNCIAWQ